MSDAFLVLDVCVYCLDGNASDGGDELPPGPEGREAFFHRGEFSPDDVAGTALQGADKVVDPDARVHVKEEVHMVRHDLHLKDAPAKGLRDLGEDLLKARVDAVHEHLPAILRAEDDMVAAAVYDMFTVMVLGLLGFR